MRRFRTQWLAFFGALVILSMSLSSAFAAKPTTTTSPDAVANFGQQVSAFVHALLVSDDEDGGDEDQDEDEAGECEAPSNDEDTDEAGEEGTDAEEGTEAEDDTADECEDTDEDTDETSDEDGDEESDEDTDEESEFKNLGQCVAEVARSDEVGENGTHGWAVVLAAQINCWLELNGDDEEDEADTDTDADADAGEDESSDDTSTAEKKPHGKSEAAHQRKLDRGSGKPAWAATKVHGGHGNGHGPKH